MLFILFAIKRHLNKRFYHYIDTRGTRVPLVRSAGRDYSIEYRKTTRFERRDSWLMPFLKHRPVSLRCQPLLKVTFNFSNGIHWSSLECDPVNYYLTYSLSMNERLDNVLARICNWNPRERKREKEIRIAIVSRK